MARARSSNKAKNRRTGQQPRNRRLKRAGSGSAKSTGPKAKPAPARAKTSRGPGSAGRQRMSRLVRRVGRPLAWLVLLIAVVYGGVLAHGFVVRSPHFRVRRVDVTPTVHVTAGDVRRLAGIKPRTNIFTVDLDRVAAKVARHPWIASAEAHRRMPNAIRITVREHKAAAAVLVQGSRAEQTRFYLVNTGSRAFKRAAAAELEGLPLITGISRAEYLRHSRSSQARIRQAVAVYRRYLVRPGRPRIGEIHVDPVEGITLYTAQRAVQVRFGRGGMAAKLRRYDRVLAELAQRGQRAATIRLDNDRHPEKVTVRLARAEQSGALPQ